MQSTKLYHLTRSSNQFTSNYLLTNVIEALEALDSTFAREHDRPSLITTGSLESKSPRVTVGSKEVDAVWSCQLVRGKVGGGIRPKQYIARPRRRD